MKKIMKRLLTGVLTLATVFTALPVTQVHAADSVYTTTDGKAGTIVKIDNGGSEVSSFEESIMNADGQIAYCIDINTNFQSGYKNRINATERMSDDQISDVALNLEYVKQYAEKHSLWVSHTQNTNAGENSEDGIWFGTSTPDDSKGALLYDTYTIEELRCDSNKGMTLIPAFDVIVSRNETVIHLGTLTDDYEPEISIHTTAADKATGEKSIVAGKSVTIVDTVTLDGLTKGTKYQLKGWQMVKSENAQLLIDGEPVESDYTFTEKKSEMEVEVSYTFNASALGGKDLVTFEELYDLSNPDEPIKVAEHKDIEDDGQTVRIEERIITIHTTATNKATLVFMQCH